MEKNVDWIFEWLIHMTRAPYTRHDAFGILLASQICQLCGLTRLWGHLVVEIRSIVIYAIVNQNQKHVFLNGVIHETYNAV